MYGTYANWLFVCLAAIFGASEIAPIAGAGHAALPWQETLVTIGLNIVGITVGRQIRMTITYLQRAKSAPASDPVFRVVALEFH